MRSDSRWDLRRLQCTSVIFFVAVLSLSLFLRHFSPSRCVSDRLPLIKQNAKAREARGLPALRPKGPRGLIQGATNDLEAMRERGSRSFVPLHAAPPLSLRHWMQAGPGSFTGWFTPSICWARR